MNPDEVVMSKMQGHGPTPQPGEKWKQKIDTNPKKKK